MNQVKLMLGFFTMFFYHGVGATWVGTWVRYQGQYPCDFYVFIRAYDQGFRHRNDMENIRITSISSISYSTLQQWNSRPHTSQRHNIDHHQIILSIFLLVKKLRCCVYLYAPCVACCHVEFSLLKVQTK